MQRSQLTHCIDRLLLVSCVVAVKCFLLQPDTAEDEFRYVPDLTLLELKAEIAEIEKKREDRKKK